MSGIKINCHTSLLYGIFASEKSYFLGIRNLIKREHANMLAHKVCEAEDGQLRVPQELIDLISDALFEREKETVAKMWRRLDSREDRRHFFSYCANIPKTEAEQAVFKKLDSMGVDVVGLGNDRSYTAGDPIPNREYHVHLSAVKTRPKIMLQPPPPGSVSIPNPKLNDNPVLRACKYMGFHGSFMALCGKAIRRFVYRDEGLEMDRCTYSPSTSTSTPDQHGKRWAERLLLCQGVEEAMRKWDTEALKAFVDLLGLEPVAYVDPSEPLKPGLHIWQGMMEDR